MRLRLYQVGFRQTETGWECRKGKYRVRLVHDARYPQIWRVFRPDGTISDMVNLARAKDVAFGLIEGMEFVGT